MESCRYCGGNAKEVCLTVSCQTCGAKTKNYTACGGEYQKEKMMAESAWNKGMYWSKDDPKWLNQPRS